MKPVKISSKGKQKLKEFWHKYKGAHFSYLAKNFLHALNKTEKKIFLSLAGLALAAAILLIGNFYFANTAIQPAFGGSFVEGVVGQPKFINPVYLSSRDVDRDIVELLFSGLVKYTSRGEIVPDLAESYTVKDDGEVWQFKLKEDVLWHDGKPLTADDVIFTVKLIQNPEAESSQRVKWLAVKVEKVSDFFVRFKLKEGYSDFLETATLKILPKHIFENISPKNLPWSLTSKNYLVGSGPFKVKKLKQDSGGYLKSLTLERNPEYYGQKPYLSKISFRFFETEEKLLREAGRRTIDGFLISDPRKFPLASRTDFKPYQFALPRYFGVFFNLKQSDILSKTEIREALSYGTDKNEILEKVFAGKGISVNSPILPDFYGFNQATVLYDFNQGKANEILERAGFKYVDGNPVRQKAVSEESGISKDLAYGSRDAQVKLLQECLAKDKAVYPEGTVSGYFGKKTEAAVSRFQEKYKEEILTPFGLSRGTGKVKSKTIEKLNELCFPSEKEAIPLEVSLKTSDNPILIEVAEVLKKQWAEIGVKLNIEKEPIAVLETEIIKPREFEALLFGEVLGYQPDPFPFWHFSQKDYPGLNITQYYNKTVNSLLEKARQAMSIEKRQQYLEEFQDVLLKDLPCIFLVQPDLVYFASKKIKGITEGKVTTPANRFASLEEWHIKTKRAWQ